MKLNAFLVVAVIACLGLVGSIYMRLLPVQSEVSDRFSVDGEVKELGSRWWFDHGYKIDFESFSLLEDTSKVMKIERVPKIKKDVWLSLNLPAPRDVLGSAFEEGNDFFLLDIRVVDSHERILLETEISAEHSIITGGLGHGESSSLYAIDREGMTGTHFEIKDYQFPIRIYVEYKLVEDRWSEIGVQEGSMEWRVGGSK